MPIFINGGYGNTDMNYEMGDIIIYVKLYIVKGPFKCYVTLFFWKLDPHPPPRNANNIKHYIFVTLFSRKSDTPYPICVT